MKVIAEIGSNWKTHNDCILSIDQAKKCGADIVKFQTYTHQDLYGTPGLRACEPDIISLSAYAKKIGIEFMCTAFSPVAYMAINQYVERHKIASSEITDLDILETVNSFRKPVILSTGGASDIDIANALLILRNVPVTLLFCVVDYPARVVDFRHLRNMRERHGGTCSYGYSDHSIDVLNIPVLARKHGCVIIEKHVNFTDHSDTPDATHSLNAREFRMMVKHLKNDLLPHESFIPNPHKRLLKCIGDLRGYFRPLA